MRKTPKHMDGRASKKIRAFDEEHREIFRRTFLSSSLMVFGGSINSQKIDKFLDRLIEASDKHPVNMGLELDSLSEGEEVKISALFGYMRHYPDPQRPAQDNLYQPFYQHYYLTNSFYISESNCLPVRIGAEHTAFNFIRRSNGILDISDENFKKTLLISLLLSQSFNACAEGSSIQPQPMIIPHGKGAFIGNAVPTDAHMYIRSGFTVIPASKNAYDNHQGTMEEFLLKYISPFSAAQIEQPFLPKALINIRTFYDETMFYPSLQRTVEKIKALLDHSDYSRAIEVATQSHISRTFNGNVSQDDVKSTYALFDELQSILKSKDWKFMSDKMTRNGHITDITHTPI